MHLLYAGLLLFRRTLIPQTAYLCFLKKITINARMNHLSLNFLIMKCHPVTHLGLDLVQHKVQENEGNGKCKWSWYMKEREMAYARSYRTVLFPPAVVNVDGHGPIGI